jgi:hypothetical protein
MLRLLVLPLVLLLFGAGPLPAAPAIVSAAGMHQAAAMPIAAERRPGEEVTLEEAVEQVRKETGGRILSAETVKSNGRRVHRIKVLTPDRRVRVVNVDADSGRR